MNNIQWEFLQDVAKLIQFAASIGLKLTGGELYRPEVMQLYYVQTGLSKTKDSQHLKRLAIDLNVFVRGNLTYNKSDIQPLGDFWESLNSKNRWGGNYKTFLDTPHFERMEQ